MRSRPRTITIADDERARIPFAMIGALILVSSVGLVVTLQSQRSATVDVDDSLAMERTASAANTALFDATTQATRDAALEPVTEPADTPLGNAISDDGTYTGDDFFERYVKLRIYLEAQERFASSAQQFREMETSISIDPVESPADAREAIESVTLTVGGGYNHTDAAFDYGDERDSGLGPGTIEVEIDDVAFTVEREGEVVAERTQPLSVTVGTPLFDLHHLTTEYEDRLDYDFADARAAGEHAGFDTRLASSLYPLVWERGYAQNDGEPIAEVVADRHVETLANDALYQIQRSVFGADDPDSDRLLTTAYTCMLAQDANHVYDAPDGGSSDVDTVLERVDETGFCDGLGYAFDEFEGEFTDPPDWTRLASQNDYLNETETVGLEESATVAAGEIETDGVIRDAIDRIYAVDAYAVTESERHVIPEGPENESPDDWTVERVEPDAQDNYEAWVTGVERVVDWRETANDRPFYEVEFVYVGEYEGSVTWSNGGRTETEHLDAFSVRYDVTLTVRGEHSPNARVDEPGTVYDYAPGPTGGNATYDTNYDGIPTEATVELLGGVTSYRNVADQFEAYLQRGDHAVYDESDLVDVATDGSPETRLDPEPARSGDEVRGWLVRDLESLERNLSDAEWTFDRHELLADPSVLREIRTDPLVADDGETVYEHRADVYANPADKVRAEVRLAYMESLRAHLEDVIDRHESQVSALDDRIGAHTDTDLPTTVDFARTQFDTDPPTGATALPDYPLLEGLEIQPRGEPSYPTFDRVTVEQVPATAADENGFASLVGRTDTVYGEPYRDVTDPGTVQLVTAGETREAATATDDLLAADDPTWDDGDLAGLEWALDAEIDAIADRAAADAAAPFDRLSAAEIEAAVRAEIEALGPVERQAILLGEGGAAIDEVAAGAAASVERPTDSSYDYYYGDFYDHLESAIRFGLDDAVGDGGRGGETARRTVALADAVRTELDDRSDDVLAERLERAADGSLADSTATATEASWLDSDLATGNLTPNRVPSGMTVTDRPNWNLLTTNLWNVHLEGSYARFAVTASTGQPGTGGETAYVREDRTVSLEVGGDEQEVGAVEPVSFESEISVPIAVPADGLGVGERTTATR